MNVRIAVMAGMVACAAWLLTLARPAAADEAGAPPIKVAVCDPITVLTKIQEGKDVMAKWKQDLETLQNQANVKQAQLQTEGDEIKLLLPTSDEYQAKIEKFTQDQANTQAWVQAAKFNMARKQREEQKKLFAEVLKSVADVAKEQGITLVINSAHAEFPEIDKQPDPNAFFQTILMHSSLYSDVSLDITDKVIIAMDKTYSATPAPAPAPSP